MELAPNEVILTLYGNVTLPPAVAALPAQVVTGLPDFPKVCLNRQYEVVRFAHGLAEVCGHLDGVAALAAMLRPCEVRTSQPRPPQMRIVILTLTDDHLRPFQAQKRQIEHLDAVLMRSLTAKRSAPQPSARRFHR